MEAKSFENHKKPMRNATSRYQQGAQRVEENSKSGEDQCHCKVWRAKSANAGGHRRKRFGGHVGGGAVSGKLFLPNIFATHGNACNHARAVAAGAGEPSSAQCS